MGAQFLETQIARLTSLEDSLDDVGREECTILQRAVAVAILLDHDGKI